MPPHHHHHHHGKPFHHRWWSEMPPKARQAAYAMGYTAESWDADEHIEYDDKKFEDCTLQERQAAMYLDMNPIDKKLDIWWEDTDPTTQQYALDIGWTQETWDDDWRIQDLPVEDLYWNELSEKQRNAAIYFGYIVVTWNENKDDDVNGEIEFLDLDGATIEPPAPIPETVDVPYVPPPEEEEEKAEEEEQEQEPAEIPEADVEVEEELDGPEEEEPADETEKTAEEQKPKKKFLIRRSKKFGGDGGSPFNHGNHRAILKLTIKADRHAVHQIAANYHGMIRKTCGTGAGKEITHQFKRGEYITGVTIRHNRLIQMLKFTTNMGNTIGPAGGKGWLLKDKEGEVEELSAPDGFQLCGFSGSAGRYIDSILFHWGPVPENLK